MIGLIHRTHQDQNKVLTKAKSQMKRLFFDEICPISNQTNMDSISFSDFLLHLTSDETS